MPHFHNPCLGGAGGQSTAAYEIEQSLRFDGSSYLLWTPSSTGDSVRKWTISLWVKQNYATGSTAKYMISAGPNTGSDTAIYPYTYDVSGVGGQYYFVQGDATRYVRSVPKYRDESAWYHMVFQSDADNATTGDKLKIFVNGERITTDTPGNAPIAQNTYWNSTNQHRIGRIGGLVNWTGYMAEFHSVDNQLVDPDQFGEYDDNGVWRPIEYTGTYGSNGFYLKFDPSATNGIGHDHSGNGNNFTPSGFDTTNSTASTYDVMSDTPTTNYCTLNPIGTTTGFTTPTNGNLETNSGIEEGSTEGTFAIPKDGNLYYYEGELIYDIGDGGKSTWFGVKQQGYTGGLYGGSKVFGFLGTDGGAYDGIILFYSYAGNNEPGLGGHVNSGTVFGFAIKYDSGTWKYYVRQGSNGWHYYNGSSWVYNTSFDETEPTTTSTNIPEDDVLVPLVNNIKVNFGQRAFEYTPPTGAKYLRSSDLPAPDIADGSDGFQTVLDTGANILTSAQSAFTNGLWWIKDRANNSTYHQLVNSVDGTSDVYRMPSYGNNTSYSAPSGSSVAWCWNLISGRTNGFDIVEYTGNGTSQNISHSLGEPPEFIITKGKSSTTPESKAFHTSLGAGKWFYPDLVNGTFTGTTVWNNTTPTASVFSVGSDDYVNKSGVDYTAYLWRSVPGFSKCGSGTAISNADNAFVYTGFRVAYLYISYVSGNAEKPALDSKRNPYNLVDTLLSWRNTDDEISNYAGIGFDFLSNGFKIRGTYYTGDFYYVAFAENPFGGFGVSPATAR